jgi:hypothetical protein
MKKLEITQEEAKRIVESRLFFRNLKVALRKLELIRAEKVVRRSTYDTLMQLGLLEPNAFRQEYANILCKRSGVSARERRFIQSVGNAVFYETKAKRRV